jgi:hypothetical protein
MAKNLPGLVPTNYYRLMKLKPVTGVTDPTMGIDGIYATRTMARLTFPESPCSNNARTLGDTAPKQFLGSLSQLIPERVNQVEATTSNVELAFLREKGSRHALSRVSLSGIFLSNAVRDSNAATFLGELRVALYDEAELRRVASQSSAAPLQQTRRSIYRFESWSTPSTEARL